MIDFSDAFERQAPPADTALEREQERLTREVAALEGREQRTVGWFFLLFFGSPIICHTARFYFDRSLFKDGWENEVWVLGAVVGFWFVVWAALAVLHNLVEKYTKQLNATRAALDNLVSLDANSSPDECIQLDEWREQDETVAAYLTALAGLGRKPVMGEYRAAEAWMTGAKGWSQKAEKRERARQACVRFAL